MKYLIDRYPEFKALKIGKAMTIPGTGVVFRKVVFTKKTQGGKAWETQ